MNRDDCGERRQNGVILNVYPDSMGGRLADVVSFLGAAQVKDTFETVYILPSIFNSDMDRGFSIIDYSLNEALAAAQDLEALGKMGIQLKLDFVLNHASVLSPQFQDILKNGTASAYRDFFIDWNRFWQGCGTMTNDGYIQPDDDCIKDMFFRKEGLPLLMVPMPDGSEIPYWNTFYQRVKYEKTSPYELVRALGIQYGTAERLAGIINQALELGARPSAIEFGAYQPYRNSILRLLHEKCSIQGQMDLNSQSPMVWQFYEKTLEALRAYGAHIVRLDAFAYAAKAPGRRNFLNEPETWELLAKLKTKADEHQITLLPEIHARYEEKIHERLADEGYMTYDFFLPGLVIHALEKHTGTWLVRWAKELCEKGIHTVNMLGCHDGIPLLDLQGLLDETEIEELIKAIVARGGHVKDLHGAKNMYYQVNATYYSALGESDAKLLLARAIQLFMPGRPQIWYLDLFAGRNDYEAVKQAGEGGHKEINRTNLTAGQIQAGLEKDVVKCQLEMIRFRNTFPAFGMGARLAAKAEDPHLLTLQWACAGFAAVLDANLENCSFSMAGTNPSGETVYEFSRGENSETGR